MKFPVKDNDGNLYTEEQYNALTADEKRTKGFLNDPDVVYYNAKDKIDTLGYSTVDGEKIPVEVKLNNMSFNFCNYTETHNSPIEGVSGPTITFIDNVITIKCTSDSEAYYTDDGTAPKFDSETGTISGTKITSDTTITLTEDTSPKTIKAVYAIKDTEGTITGISNVSSKTCVFVKPTVATPVITVTGTEATATCETEGSTIYMKKNSEEYSEVSSITVADGDMVYAYATKTDYNDSAVASKKASVTVIGPSVTVAIEPSTGTAGTETSVTVTATVTKGDGDISTVTCNGTEMSGTYPTYTFTETETATKSFEVVVTDSNGKTVNKTVKYTATTPKVTLSIGSTATVGTAANYTVSPSDATVTTTDSSAVIDTENNTITFSAAGSYTVTASKTGYTSASTTVTVSEASVEGTYMIPTKGVNSTFSDNFVDDEESTFEEDFGEVSGVGEFVTATSIPSEEMSLVTTADNPMGIFYTENLGTITKIERYDEIITSWSEVEFTTTSATFKDGVWKMTKANVAAGGTFKFRITSTK